MTPFSMPLAPDLSTQRGHRMQRQLRSLLDRDAGGVQRRDERANVVSRDMICGQGDGYRQRTVCRVVPSRVTYVPVYHFHGARRSMSLSQARSASRMRSTVARSAASNWRGSPSRPV